MKLVRKNLEKDQGGVLALIPEEEEDMWHVYNLISIGDSGTYYMNKIFLDQTALSARYT